MEILRKNCVAIITWLFLFTPPSKLQLWTKVLGHFCLSGAFSNSHRSNPAPLTPQTMLDPCIQNFFGLSTLYRVGWGELQENFEKDALFKEGTDKWQKNMNTAVLSQGLCPGLQFESESPLYNGPKQAKRGCCLTVQRPAEFKVLFSPNFYDILWIDQVL